MLKNNDPANIWAWIDKDADRLIQKGGLHKAIIEHYTDFWSSYDNDYVAAELAVTQALEAASETDEIKWQLHLRHWRVQLWLKQRQTRRALPEAVDLLSLATDRRVRDVPQRICAFHDVVECYLHIDPAGYYEDIVANAQDVLAQLPKRHPCATCARSNLARASAAAGKAQEAEHWMNQVKATLTQKLYNGMMINLGITSSLIGNWDEAERYFLQARDAGQQDKNRADFISATLKLVRVYLEKDEMQTALDMLRNARQNMKFQSHPDDLAQLAEVEGRVAVRLQRPQTALEHLTQAARLYLDLGCYRDAAEIALYAAEVAREAKLEPSEEGLDLAAQAVGQLPPASEDLYQRLATFDRQPIAPSAGVQKSSITSAEEQDQQELHTLEELLQQHITQGHMIDVTMMLYRLAIWYSSHNQIRAAVDYLVAEAALERLMKLPFDEREEAVTALGRLRKSLPDNTVEASLNAMQSGPPPWMLPLFPEIPLVYWRWILRGIEAEIADRPFVEPEPQEQDGSWTFNDWLNYSSSMAALILRFYQRSDPQEFALWAETMDEQAQAIADDASSTSRRADAEPIISLVHSFAALARGASVAEVAAFILPPFSDVINRVAEIAQKPVWYHPEASPIDFLVEQAAQKAVRALRTHDQGRSRRLKNLALRYKLMAIDLREQEPLVPIARFLDALRDLVLLEGEQLPTVEQPLEAPFDTILSAVFESGQVVETEES